MTMLSRAEPARYRVWLALIVLGGLAARLLHVSVALGSDDQVWIKVAREISAHAVHTDEPVYYTRLVWTWILILWGLLGSLSLEWTAVLMFVLSGLTTVFIAEGTRTAFDTRSALLAAVVYAAHPLAITFDAYTLPDGLAVCMLAACIWRFLHYLRTPRLTALIVPGLLIGLLFGVKNYFMLVSLACALTMLMLPMAPRLRVTHTGALAAVAIGGLAFALLLGLVSGVDTTSHVTSAGNYVDYISRELAPGQGIESARDVVSLLVERGASLTILFFGFGTIMGLLTLFGFTFSVAQLRASPAQQFLVSMVVIFLLFLMFMPVRLSPLLFTQLHERYLTILLPPLAISAGVALAAMQEALVTRPLRTAAGCLFAAAVGYCLWVPNGLHDQYGRLEMRGVAQVISAAPGHGTATLLLPSNYRRLVPDSYRNGSVQLRFVDLRSPTGIAAALDSAEADSSIAVVAIRAPYRSLVEKLRAGDYSEDVGYGRFAMLMREAGARGLVVGEVRVPYDTLRVWLARAGVATRGQLVGWVISRSAR